MTPDRSRNSVVNVELVETCTRYEVAPDDAPHDSVVGTATFVAAFAGDESTGTGGIPGGGVAAVVKLRTVE